MSIFKYRPLFLVILVTYVVYDLNTALAVPVPNNINVLSPIIESPNNHEIAVTPADEFESEFLTTEVAITPSFSLPLCNGTVPIITPCYSADGIILPTRPCPEGEARDSHGVCRQVW